MMPDTERLLGVVVYSVLNFVPFTLLAVYPFRKALRFSEKVTVAMIVLLSIIQIALRVVAVFGGGDKGLLTGLATLAYAVFYFVVVKAEPGKMIFTLLMLYNIADMVVISSKCLEGQIFGKAAAAETYGWTASFTMLAVSIVCLVPIAVCFKKYYSESISRQAGASSWRYLWLIPATFYLVWFCCCYGKNETALEIALEPSQAILTILINTGAFLIYHTVLRLINEQEANQTLAAQNYNLKLQALQFENLKNQIEQTRQARHDIRHHITVLDSCIATGDYDRLREYLKSYKKSLPDDSGQMICSNYTANTLLLFFRQQASEKNIEFITDIQLPEKVGVPDYIISVLLGNLLENALDACKEAQPGNAWIKIKAKMTTDAAFFQVENTCRQQPVRLDDGRHVSSKRNSVGTGLESVRSIAAKYDGMMETEYRDHSFRVSVMLSISEQNKVQK